ncbi:YbhB/YbcL family Raf kinase inhibitor-like protein NDAI_0H01070 [Naumovozyma dairenensis CBS 421]|uniref:Carboxypeptidase Y inhibitor n=1 Tax=Naumovozyma dairenensis (strain ATCC 10597 / BCRC 20456 / CBS 421 / NBRC 0211 / NRRL Y-12639) TaxID=1071378 RepID=G0WES0_NAUDC|nr:hypothetical protein NDAI_0H01070 [Naumovozyma dairenensis CBS 421]CCD26281.1 hypothetical protein NDAI_0H01070 [Naumovozyma dairenensis CBS 421]
MEYSININKAAIDGLSKHDILKDVVKDPNFQPKGILSAEFNSSNSTVAMGNTLSVEATASKPQVQFILNDSVKDINEDDHFTLVMTDPDAPSRTDKKWSEFCHYVETNIKLDGFARDSEFLASEISNGHEMMPYKGPGPPKGTGPHRYVLLFYKQTPGVTLTKVKDRPNWGYGQPAVGVHKWASENKLSLLAVNFFFAETK